MVFKNMKKIIPLLLVLPILWLFHNRMANWHFHELSNGIVIEHAHPYEKSPGTSSENHQHSAFEFLLLDLLFKAVYFILVLASFYQFFLRKLLVFKELLIQQFVSLILQGIPSLRAPPSV